MELRELLHFVLVKNEKFNITVGGLVVAAIVIIATYIGLQIIRYLLWRYLKKKNLEKGGLYSIFKLIKYFVWVLVIVALLETVGMKISVLLAGFAALLVGVGLGIQQLFSDVTSGVLLLFERNLQLNDVIQMEDGTVGKVIDIGIRTSKLKTRDDIVMVIPNSKFIMDRIINWSHSEQITRFNVKVGVAYGSDVKLVTKVLLECAHEEDQITKEPPPFVRFIDFGDSSLDFQLYFWVTNSFRVENIKSNLRYLINQKLRDNNITIPFPQRDVHLKKDL